MLQQTRGRGKDEVRRGRADDEQFDVARGDAGRFQRGARRTLGQVARGLAFRRDVTLADAGARRDPLVAGFDELLQLGIGDDPFRQEAAGPGDA